MSDHTETIKARLRGAAGGVIDDHGLLAAADLVARRFPVSDCEGDTDG